MTDTLTIRVQDTTTATASANFIIPVGNPFVIGATDPLPGATQGVAYSTPLSPAGATGAITWLFMATTGSNTWGFTGNNITGTPTTAETDTLYVLGMDSLGIPQSAVFHITVAPSGGGGSLVVTVDGGLPVPPGAQGVPYEIIVHCTTGTGALVWNKISGPAYGSVATLNATSGLFSGTPTGITGGDVFVIGVTDSLSNTGSITFTL